MIYIMLNYARSGGTVLNKCLGSYDEVIMLSEVNPIDNGNNPRYGKMDALKQCKMWYNLNLKSSNFKDIIEECNNYCLANNKKLIVRDWSTVNFRKMNENNFDPPCRFLTVEELEKIDELKIFTLVRDSIDLFISNALDMNDLEGYSNFIRAIRKMGPNKIIKYEDFCRSPAKVLKNLTEFLDLEYSEQWKKYYQNDRVNGDSVIKGGSRGVRQGVIRPLKRKRIGKQAIQEINNSIFIKQINEYLGYPSNYFEGALIESKFDKFKSFLSRIR